MLEGNAYPDLLGWDNLNKAALQAVLKLYTEDPVSDQKPTVMMRIDDLEWKPRQEQTYWRACSHWAHI